MTPPAARREGVAVHHDVRLAYEVHAAPPRSTGARPTVLLVHGLGYARWGWEPVVEPLARSAQVVLFDNRGIGESDVPDGPYDAATMAGDALAVLDAVGARRATVVGTSLGGMIAQELAARWPERVDALVLLASTPGGGAAYPMPAVTRALLARMPDMPPHEALREAVANALSDRTLREHPEVAERILAHRLAAPQDPRGWQAQAAAGTTYDAGERLADIDVPCRIVHGRDDVVIDPRNGHLLAAAIPGAQLVELDGVGHLPYWERPDAVVREILAVLPRG